MPHRGGGAVGVVAAGAIGMVAAGFWGMAKRAGRGDFAQKDTPIVPIAQSRPNDHFRIIAYFLNGRGWGSDREVRFPVGEE